MDRQFIVDGIYTRIMNEKSLFVNRIADLCEEKPDFIDYIYNGRRELTQIDRDDAKRFLIDFGYNLKEINSIEVGFDGDLRQVMIVNARIFAYKSSEKDSLWSIEPSVYNDIKVEVNTTVNVPFNFYDNQYDK